jgi:hypothetical protein
MILQNGGYNSSLSMLSGSTSIDDLHALPMSLTLRAIALAMEGSSLKLDAARREIQRAIMLCPSDIRIWTALACVRSRQKYLKE